MIAGALSGALNDGPFRRDRVFNVDVPEYCPKVDAALLEPRTTWKSPSDYDAQAFRLAEMFGENFRGLESEASEEVRRAGPIDTRP